jgi:redox-sensing transcriptional repressor
MDANQAIRHYRSRSESAAQPVANDLIEAGVKIIFNYSEALLDVPPDVQLHTSNPAAELLTALYFHLM